MCRLKETFLNEKQISQPNYTQHRTQLDCVCPLTLLVAPLFWFGSQMLTWFHGVTWFLSLGQRCLPTLAFQGESNDKKPNLHICTAMDLSALRRRRSQINRNILSIADESVMYRAPRNISMLRS